MDSPVILYIEDNLDNRKLVSRVLQASGFIVYGVEDGAKGLAFVAKQIPDLILMDLQLPEVDGYTITKEMRKMEKLTAIPIVALTANVLKEDKERSKKAGCDGFIHKPIDVDLLPAQIESYLSAQTTVNKFV
ncbi:MAG: response regulator [Chloroflexi bacterium]|nr:response regulator [Chloroflexota bacterium]